jgi:hypothetical protein
MITGANTNIRYRGIMFHVQTEDSGRANPHIISHVYHGGTILGTHKTDYADQLDAEDLIGVVRGLIEKQHASMLERLGGGDFDEVIRQRLGDAAMGLDSKPDTEPEALAAPVAKPDVAAEKRAAAPPLLAAAQRAERRFGEGIGSEKPLDEVILDYLAQKARARSADRPGTPARKNRSGG